MLKNTYPSVFVCILDSIINALMSYNHVNYMLKNLIFFTFNWTHKYFLFKKIVNRTDYHIYSCRYYFSVTLIQWRSYVQGEKKALFMTSHLWTFKEGTSCYQGSHSDHSRDVCYYVFSTINWNLSGKSTFENKITFIPSFLVSEEWIIRIPR